MAYLSSGHRPDSGIRAHVVVGSENRRVLGDIQLVFGYTDTLYLTYEEAVRVRSVITDAINEVEQETEVAALAALIEP